MREPINEWVALFKELQIARSITGLCLKAVLSVVSAIGYTKAGVISATD
jgi:hypothetical protein